MRAGGRGLPGRRRAKPCWTEARPPRPRVASAEAPFLEASLAEAPGHLDPRGARCRPVSPRAPPSPTPSSSPIHLSRTPPGSLPPTSDNLPALQLLTHPRVPQPGRNNLKTLSFESQRPPQPSSLIGQVGKRKPREGRSLLKAAQLSRGRNGARTLDRGSHPDPRKLSLDRCGPCLFVCFGFS